MFTYLLGVSVLLALFLKSASGFTVPTTNRISPSHRSSMTKLRVIFDNKLSEEDSLRQATAVEALEKLRERQQAELEETDRLLKLVTTKGQEGSASHQSLSTAASILSGVDYGFLSRSEGAPSTLQGGWDSLGTAYGGPPSNLWTLGKNQFIRNWNAIKGEYNDEPEKILTLEQERWQAALEELTLNSTAIWEREFADGPLEAPWIIKLPYLAVCYMLDVMFEGRYVPSRFFLLETVARMPYFSYISMLHLYETLGFWRRSADVKRIHFAEELNEFRHLLIMESLGGDQAWWVRFVAQHSAVVYYVVLCVLFAMSPSLSYRFSELLETHAVNTYGVFLDENEQLLKKLPPTTAASDYYSLGSSDPFYAEFQTAALASGSDVRVCNIAKWLFNIVNSAFSHVMLPRFLVLFSFDDQEKTCKTCTMSLQP
jgi:ubiquinol oxidase